MAIDEKLQELKLRIKKYLELENVSILAGAGTSLKMGRGELGRGSFIIPFA